jgi:hypothetical protein
LFFGKIVYEIDCQIVLNWNDRIPSPYAEHPLISGVWRQRTVLSYQILCSFVHIWSMALLRFFVWNHRQVGLKPWSCYCMCYNPWIHKVITMLSGLVELPEFPSWSSLIYCLFLFSFFASAFVVLSGFAIWVLAFDPSQIMGSWMSSRPGLVECIFGLSICLI